MGFLSGDKKGENDKEDLRILATHIETINQRLDSLQGGDQMREAFSKLDYSLNYLHKIAQEQGKQTDMLSHIQNNNSANHEAIRMLLEEMDTLKSIVKQLVHVYREETLLLKDREEGVKAKLQEIEDRIDGSVAKNEH